MATAASYPRPALNGCCGERPPWMHDLRSANGRTQKLLTRSPSRASPPHGSARPPAPVFGIWAGTWPTIALLGMVIGADDAAPSTTLGKLARSPLMLTSTRYVPGGNSALCP